MKWELIRSDRFWNFFLGEGFLLQFYNLHDHREISGRVFQDIRKTDG